MQRSPGFVLPAVLVLSSACAFAQATTKQAQVTPPPPVQAPEVARTADGTIEVGELDHVPYRIDVPANWNHHLILFQHGYSESPLHFRTLAPSEVHMRPMLKRGYAVAQSAYAQTGWALESGYNDVERLRKYFGKAYGQPKETYAVGMSMGGALTVEMIERNPKPYVGALNLCGAVGPTIFHVNRRFALRAAFDFYFPGLLPPLDPVPANFADSDAMRTKVLGPLNAKSAQAEMMRNLTGLHSNPDVARAMVYFTYVIGDLQRKAGANPFDNRNTIYIGSSLDPKTDYALNDGVARYAGDPKAIQYLAEFYTPSGKVTKPILAIHTVYDPLVAPANLAMYYQMVEQAGYEHNYVQKWVYREGHCTMSTDEIARGFDELVGWVHTSRPPQPGLLR